MQHKNMQIHDTLKCVIELKNSHYANILVVITDSGTEKQGLSPLIF